MSDSAVQIPGELLARLARFGRVHLREQVDSTNEYAFSLAARREPAVVLARRQTAGRGRFRRRWFSDDGSLTFSLLLFVGADDPALPIGQLTLLTGLAVSQGIQDVTGARATIRWPNDLMLNERKICGILCKQRRDALVVGIGLNVNQSAFPEIADLGEAGSIAQATGREWEKLELLDAILRRFFAILERARNDELPALLDEFKTRSAVLHRRVEARTMFRRHIGTVVDIDSEGRLVIRRSDGGIVAVNSGQVRRLR
ncbi:MAG TPA: biotin--[acetyl-CoA-carboxylase] ligase [candidate division WOR-3 bacterium]|uniref:biotin--[biotin carboxyl-carrier protein] ligase n=1 Tax=candidate division WOR-3 bacterium TaxID=2052148 RepID=A0A7V0T4H0_UNCW3|nr:biotin--[acetyl-CoA-carboxylase] ligase [candidate division WOR-3 bacterium]